MKIKKLFYIGCIMAMPLISGCGRIEDVERDVARTRASMERTEIIAKRIEEKLDRLLEGTK